MSSISKLMTIVSFVSTLLPAPTAGYWPKRGLAANDDIPIGQFGGTREGAASEVNWQYNWGSTTSQKQSFCEYVPMLWDLGSSATSTWFSHASHWVTDGGSGHLLAFNEPELSGQSNISPSQAAAGFLKYLTPYHGSASLGSPAVSNDGYTWLSEFLGLCTKCKIDFIAVHWYNNYDQFDDLKNWINKICALANGKQVWLTEVRVHYQQEMNVEC